MKKTTQGFTLIELLVVIAIIGILASVVLASLNSARNKGVDSAIKAQMVSVATQAEIFYHNANGVYTNACTASGGIGSLVQAASTNAGTGIIVTTGALQAATTANCYATASGYAASVKLKLPTTATYFCVDSNNTKKETTTPLAANSIACP